MVLAEVGNGVMTLCWTVFFLASRGLKAWLVRRLDRWRWLHGCSVMRCWRCSPGSLAGSTGSWDANRGRFGTT